MKTVAEIQKMIDDIDTFWKERHNYATTMRNKDSRRRNFYYKVRLYLEKSPRHEFLEKQLDKTKNYIRITNERGTAELLKRIYPNLDYKQARNQWRKDNQVSYWRAQQKVLEFILN